MARKKTSRKKLNLTNLDALATIMPETAENSQSTATVEESTPSSAQVNTVPVEEVSTTSTPSAAADVAEPSSASTVVSATLVPEEPSSASTVVSATPVPEEPSSASTVVSATSVPEEPSSASTVVSATSVPEEPITTPTIVATVPKEKVIFLAPHPALTKERKLDYRPQRPKPQPIQTVPEATNEAGELFKAGDKINVKAPWGGVAIAEIVSFYLDNHGGVWAQYHPLSCIPKWTWNGGCTRAHLLQKAS